jgi:DNA polymerase III epsilon subunit family exonuclease
MQLRLDAADRLVELVEERRGPVQVDEAARLVLKLGSQVPVGLARSLLDEAVRDDARLRWSGDLVALTEAPGEALSIEQATFVVFDLETTGLRPATSRPCEIGAVRVRELALGERFQTLANPGARLDPAIAALTGLRDAELRRAPPVQAAVRRFLGFAGDAVLVAHNARFDMAFLDNETMRATGRRTAATVVDTVGLARRLLGRQPANLAALSYRFATEARPCHRALPDAEATAEILLCLIGMAQERGARTVADLVELAATRPRRVHRKRSLAFGAPPRPGVYLFRDANDQVLYVGRARDLRARLRSYFRSERQRPAVEAALGALERVEWRTRGSEVEAALEELRLLRELRPVANARNARPDRYVYLRPRGDTLVCTQTPTRLGPIRSRTRARLACRALDGASAEELERPELALPRLRARLSHLADCRRFEDAARLRDRIGALEQLVDSLRRLDRLRHARCCLIVPAIDPGYARAIFVAGGRVAAVRTLPRGEGARLEVEAGLAETNCGTPDHLAADDLDALLVIGTFLRHPPPELRVAPLEAKEILRLAAALPPALDGETRPRSRARAA